MSASKTLSKSAKPSVSKRSSKDHDTHKIAKSKQKLKAILANETELEPAEKISRITKFISRALSSVFETRDAQKGPVALDRRLKLVEWACQASLMYINGVYRPPIANSAQGTKAKKAALHEINRVCGDISRYMSTSKSIVRTDRALSDEELFVRDFWRVSALRYYDESSLSLAEYDVRIKHLYTSNTTDDLMFVLLLNMRRLAQTTEAERETRIAPVENRHVFVETSAHALFSLLDHLPDSKAQSIQRDWAVLVTGVTDQCKRVEAGLPAILRSLLKKIPKMLKVWNESGINSITANEVDMIMIGLVLLAEIMGILLNERLAPVPISTLLKTEPLRPRVLSFLDSEKTLDFEKQEVKWLVGHTKLQGIPLRNKIMRLNSCPSYYFDTRLAEHA